MKKPELDIKDKKFKYFIDELVEEGLTPDEIIKEAKIEFAYPFEFWDEVKKMLIRNSKKSIV